MRGQAGKPGGNRKEKEGKPVEKRLVGFEGNGRKTTCIQKTGER